MKKALLPAAALLSLGILAAPPSMPDAAALDKMSNRFARVEMRVDLSGLAPGDRTALAKLVQASRVVAALYREQLWSQNEAVLAKLRRDATPRGKARLRYYLINQSPWSVVDGKSAFLPGVPAKEPPGANFYPADATKQEIEAWMAKLPEAQKKDAESWFTVIRRASDRKLRIVPYSEAYKTRLTAIAALLRDAANATPNASLRKFLSLRADALLSNDYYASDLAWMDIDAPVDPTIGPYETYDDELLGWKASFESYVLVRDEKESAKLAMFSAHLQEIEDGLPIDPSQRNPKIGAAAPIRVVNEVFAAGERGVKTAAYNLPNDERVTREKGSKRIMLKNVQQAKFDKTLIPIAAKTLPAKDRTDLSFDSFFTHILAHELTHGLGPHDIKVGGKDTTVRKELKELYGAIEEAKADVTGLFALQLLMDRGVEGLPNGPEAERKLYTTFLASAFRTLRFGADDAHGKGMVVQVNALLDKGGFVVNPDGTFAVDFAKIKNAVRELDHDLLTLEATGDYAGAKRLLDSSTIGPEVRKALDALTDVPVDIDPVYVTADELTKR
jgi:hypothetical protein